MSLTADLAPVGAAAVAGGFAFAGVVWQARKTRRLNTDEHAVNAEKLDRIETKVEQAAWKVDAVADELRQHKRDHHARRRWFR